VHAAHASVSPGLVERALAAAEPAARAAAIAARRDRRDEAAHERRRRVDRDHALDACQARPEQAAIAAPSAARRSPSQAVALLRGAGNNMSATSTAIMPPATAQFGPQLRHLGGGVRRGGTHRTALLHVQQHRFERRPQRLDERFGPDAEHHEADHQRQRRERVRAGHRSANCACSRMLQRAVGDAHHGSEQVGGRQHRRRGTASAPSSGKGALLVKRPTTPRNSPGTRRGPATRPPRGRRPAGATRSAASAGRDRRNRRSGDGARGRRRTPTSRNNSAAESPCVTACTMPPASAGQGATSEPEQAEAHVRDRRVGDQALQVASGRAPPAPPTGCRAGRANRASAPRRRLPSREQWQRDAVEAVDAELEQHDAGEQHRHRRRRLHVRVRQPGVQRHRRDLHEAREQQGEEPERRQRHAEEAHLAPALPLQREMAQVKTAWHQHHGRGTGCLVTALHAQAVQRLPTVDADCGNGLRWHRDAAPFGRRRRPQQHQ
jgi:hypothetical protein